MYTLSLLSLKGVAWLIASNNTSLQRLCLAPDYLSSARQRPHLPSKDFFVEGRALGKGRRSAKNVFAERQAFGKGSLSVKNIFPKRQALDKDSHSAKR